MVANRPRRLDQTHQIPPHIQNPTKIRSHLSQRSQFTILHQFHHLITIENNKIALKITLIQRDKPHNQQRRLAKNNLQLILQPDLIQKAKNQYQQPSCSQLYPHFPQPQSSSSIPLSKSTDIFTLRQKNKIIIIINNTT
jgi:hypothetical protein